MGKEATKAEVISIADHRSDRGAKADAVPVPEQTAEQKEQQRRETRIISGRESGMAVLVSALRHGRTPQAYVVIDAILDLGVQAEQTRALFNQAGESFNQIAQTIGQMLGYLAACEARRRLRFYRRWFAPHPEFPQFGPHVQSETEQAPPVIPQATVAAAVAEAKTVH